MRISSVERGDTGFVAGIGALYEGFLQSVWDRRVRSHMGCCSGFEELALCYDEGVAWESAVSIWMTDR